MHPICIVSLEKIVSFEAAYGRKTCLYNDRSIWLHISGNKIVILQGGCMDSVNCECICIAFDFLFMGSWRSLLDEFLQCSYRAIRKSARKCL